MQNKLDYAEATLPALPSQAAVEAPLKSFSNHLKPALARRVRSLRSRIGGSLVREYLGKL
jgi:hypothetical protein